jgi:cytochrome c biogenesis protein CcmG/thiol:disulfide interchange protein DsbE
VTVLAVSVVAGSCARRPDPGPAAGPEPTTSLLPTTPTALPEFTPERFQALLAQLRGTPVLVNFWGSWCGPCYQEAPDIAKASKAFEGRVQFLGVDINDQVGPAREFIEEFGWTFPSVSDPTNAILASMDLTGAPVTIVFDASGTRVFNWVGGITEDQLTGALNDVLDA